jgi:CHAD domain-containing protein/adenylate cyclase class IV
MNTNGRIETEAKFIIPDASVFAELKQITRLAAFELKPLGTKDLVDRYLDTDTRRIFQAGYACRIRKSWDKQLLTLKALTAAEGHLHRRQEIEAEVAGDQPQNWPESEARRLILEMTGTAALQTLFVIHQKRHQFHAFLEGQPVIEFSLDEVSLQNEATPDYFELEAELIEAGTEADLTAFVNALVANWSLQPENQSKFERALALLNRQPEEEGTVQELSDPERSALNRMAGNANKNLARRAMILLMGESGMSPLNIAHELELTVRTVRRWQREFQRQRLGIFPEEVLTQADDRHKDQPSTTPVGDKSSSRKGKRSKLQAAVQYPVRKKIGLEPTDTMAEAGRKVIGFHFARMLKHEPGTRLGEDIEELHVMRVATRRMRAAFDVFGDVYSKKKLKPLRRGLKATGRALGRVRDLDVFIEKMGHYQQSLLEEERPGVEPLLETWRDKREAARQEMLVYLDSKGYSVFKQNMLEFLETEGFAAKPVAVNVAEPYQLRHIVPRLVYTRYEAMRAFDNVLESASLETLHSLRLAFKAFRYTLEFFQELLGTEVKMVIDEVKAMQDHLGNLNDANVASDISRDYLANWEEHQLHLPLVERRSPTQMVSYLTSKLDERHRLLVTFPEKWAHFNRAELRRNLALAVAAL